MRRGAMVFILVALGSVALSGCVPVGVLRGPLGETELTFAAKNEKKYLIVENSSNTAGELGKSFLKGAGATSFKVIVGVELGTIKPCEFPTPGQKLEKKGDACTLGVELIAEPGPTATLVVEYGALYGKQTEGKAEIVLKS